MDQLNLEGKKVLIAGGSGLVGRALVTELRGCSVEVLHPPRNELDLADAHQTREFFAAKQFDVAILAAARVGGIKANMTQPYDFLSDNLQIQTNFLRSAHETEVPRLVFLGSSCIYPRSAPQPIPETCLMSGPLEPTNSAYAIAKLAGIEFVQAIRSQFGRRWISVLPSNLYGPGDNFNEDSSHVVPGLLRKFHKASEAEANRVELWGTGQVRREFLHSADAAKGILFATENYDGDLPLNIGFGSDQTIADLAQLIAETVGFAGEIDWNTEMPDGVPRKLLDSKTIFDLGWQPTIDLRQGIADTYTWMLENLAELRT